MPRPSADVVALLEAWLAAAKSGRLTDIHVLARFADGTYVPAYEIKRERLDEMLLEMRTAVIWLQIDENSQAHDES